jgi:DNA-binding FadR family transcriptional regulator
MDDENAYDEMDFSFHTMIARGSLNEYVLSALESLFSRLVPYRPYPFLGLGRIKQSRAEHGVILEALLSRDAQLSEQTMRRHLTVRSRLFLSTISRVAGAGVPLGIPESPGAGDEVSSNKMKAQ